MLVGNRMGQAFKRVYGAHMLPAKLSLALTGGNLKRVLLDAVGYCLIASFGLPGLSSPDLSDRHENYHLHHIAILFSISARWFDLPHRIASHRIASHRIAPTARMRPHQAADSSSSCVDVSETHAA